MDGIFAKLDRAEEKNRSHNIGEPAIMLLRKYSLDGAVQEVWDRKVGKEDVPDWLSLNIEDFFTPVYACTMKREHCKEFLKSLKRCALRNGYELRDTLENCYTRSWFTFKLIYDIPDVKEPECE